MAIGFKHGHCGGEQLDFRVVNRSSQPASPRENTLWISTTNALNGWTYGPDMPLRRSKNKNFATYPYTNTTVTVSGVTYTDNGDGTVTVNGTATKDAYFRASKASAEDGMFLLPAGTYTLSGCPAGGSASTYMVQLLPLDADLQAHSAIEDHGNGKTFTLSEDTLCRMNFLVKSGAKVSGLTAYFQVEKGTEKTAFEKGNANGQVWIRPDHGSAISFNAFRRNGKGNITVHPGACMLFRTGYGWQDYTGNTKIFQGGEWKTLEAPWDGYYYHSGDQCADVTGGWTASGWTVDTWPQVDTVQLNADHIYFECSVNQTAVVGTAQAVDLTAVDTLKAEVEILSMGQVVMCISPTKRYDDKVAEVEWSAKGAHTYSLDVSGYRGNYYIIFYMYGSGAKGQNPMAEIREVRGE